MTQVVRAGTGSLAAAALVGLLVTSTGPAAAAECVPADAEYRPVVLEPARTEQRLLSPGVEATTRKVVEWFHTDTPPAGEGWQPTGETEKHVTRAAQDGSPAEIVYEWQLLLKAAWIEVKVITPGTAAVYETQWVFQQVQTGRLHSSPDPEWNANPNTQSEGWVRIRSESVLVEPAVPAVTETVERPAEYDTETVWAAESPGDGWERTGEDDWLETKPAVDPVVEESHTDYQFVRTEDIPAVPPAYTTVTIPAVTELQLVTPAVTCPDPEAPGGPQPQPEPPTGDPTAPGPDDPNPDDPDANPTRPTPGQDTDPNPGPVPPTDHPDPDERPRPGDTISDRPDPRRPAPVLHTPTTLPDTGAPATNGLILAGLGLIGTGARLLRRR